MLSTTPDDAKTALDRWLTRYGSPDAYLKWRSALGTSKAPFLAFSSIAGDEQILARLSDKDAAAIASAAEAMIAEVSSSEAAARATRTTALAAEVVQKRIVAWRRANARAKSMNEWGEYIPPPRREASEPPEDEPRVMSERWMLETLSSDFPHVRPACARYALNMAHRLGVGGLTALGAPMAKVLALAAARVAAQSSLNHLPGDPLPTDQALEVVQIVQDWALRSGDNPLPGGTLNGSRSSLLSRVKSRVLDANACVALAAQLPGGVAAPGYAQWEDALENHAFVLLANRNYGMDDLTFDEARQIGSAAGRLAAYAIANPACALPQLPDGWSATPSMVFKLASSIVGDELMPRRAPISWFRQQPAELPVQHELPEEPVSPAGGKSIFTERPAWTGVMPRR